MTEHNLSPNSNKSSSVAKTLGALTRKASNAIKGITAIGLDTSLRVAKSSITDSYSQLGARLKSPSTQRISIGSLKSVIKLQSGLEAQFENASVEISFISPTIVSLDWSPGEPPIYSSNLLGQDHKTSVYFLAGEDRWYISSSDIDIVLSTDGTIRAYHRGSYKAKKSVVARTQGQYSQIVWEARPPNRLGPGWIHSATLRKEECIYGLGEQARSLNLRGSSFELWNRDPGGSYGPGQNPIYMSIPTYLGLHSGGSYLVFHDNSYRSTITIGDRLEARFSGGRLRSYLIIGSPPKLLEDYCSLTAKPPLPPLWALGYHQSKWGYASQQEVTEIARRFHELEIPLSAIHLDLDYMDGFRVFTVDRSKFPEMSAMTSQLKKSQIHTVAIVDCGVKVDDNYDIYKQGLQGGMFCKLGNGKLAHGLVWPGDCVFPDFLDEKVRDWWGSYYSRLCDLGIDGIWHDMNEPTSLALWGDRSLPKETVHNCNGRQTSHLEAHNRYALFENSAAFDAIRSLRPEQRPFILTRSGWAGVSQHAWHWTADVDTSWDGLAQQIPTILGLSLSGVQYSGSDIGGFSANPSSELYIRWLQMASYMPFFRTHSSVTTKNREPWTFDENSRNIITETIKFRYRLLPYFYTLAFEASQNGQPLLRPTWWIDSENPELWQLEDSFLLGNDLLVAPIVTEHHVNKVIYLPSGHWYELFPELQSPSSSFKESALIGNRSAGFSASLSEIPVLARAGSIIPLVREGHYQTTQNVLDQIELHVFPDSSGKAFGSLYRDSGEGYGEYVLDNFTFTSDIQVDDHNYPQLRETYANVRDATSSGEHDLPGTTRAHISRETTGTFKGTDTTIEVVLHACSIEQLLQGDKILQRSSSRNRFTLV